MPDVQPGSFLTLHYRMSGPQGQVIIDTFAGPPATLSLGAGELSPAIEQRLIGLAEGSHSVIEMAAGEAFGPRQPERVQWLARKLLSELGGAQQPYAVGDVVPSYEVTFTLVPDGPQWQVSVPKAGADVVGRAAALMQAVADDVAGISGIT